MKTHYTPSMSPSAGLDRISLFHRNRDRMRAGGLLVLGAMGRIRWSGSRCRRLPRDIDTLRRAARAEATHIIGAARYVASHSHVPAQRHEALRVEQNVRAFLRSDYNPLPGNLPCR